MPAHLHPALLCCATLSLAAHAVLLDALDLTPDVRRQVGGAAVQGAASTATTMQIRMVHAVDDTLRAGTHPDQPDQATMPTPMEEALEAPTSSAIDVHAERLDEAAAALSPPPDTSDDITAPALTATTPTPDPLPGPSTDAYIPRPKLSIPPVAQNHVLLIAPEGQRKAARRVGVLALYIDEAGRVHHIEPAEPRLPLEYERVAREAFMHTVFTPGQLDGRIVKSRIRVEVVFDNTPLDDAAPQGSL